MVPHYHNIMNYNNVEETLRKILCAKSLDKAQELASTLLEVNQRPMVPITHRPVSPQPKPYVYPHPDMAFITPYQIVPNFYDYDVADDL